MIYPNAISTIRVDQLPSDTLSLTSLIAHAVAGVLPGTTDLKKASVQEFVDLVATTVTTIGGIGFLPISVTDGQQLPNVPLSPSFFLAGAGTYLNVNGYPDVIATGQLNAIMSLSDHWELAVEIPVIFPTTSFSKTVVYSGTAITTFIGFSGTVFNLNTGMFCNYTIAGSDITVTTEAYNNDNLLITS